MHAVRDKYFENLCNQLQNAVGTEEVHHAAEGLRRYVRDQHLIIRQRLSPYIQKAFASLSSSEAQSN